MNRKIVSVITAAMLFAMSGSVTAFAEETSAAVTETATDIQTTSEITERTKESAESESVTTTKTEEIVDEIFERANDDNKYYTDDYYDTEGNATLIKEEQVIYESEEMQFIAVTTKSGDVFYILINYSAASDENNVYFLNKVDSLDLYSLLYMTDEEKESGIDPENVQKAEDAVLGHTSSETVETATDETAESGENTQKTVTKQSGEMNTTLLFGIGIIALIAIGFVGFKMFGKKPVKKNVSDDFDEQDEDDANEDDEF